MTKNNIEIERRYILRAKPVALADEEFEIFQKYSANGWRYREQASGSEVVYYKTRKAVIASGVNEEEEYVIAQEEFMNDSGVATKGISKTRSVFHHEGLRFEVDSFHHLQLVIMEVELDSIDQVFTVPDFLQELIIFEITGIREFSNSSLASAEYLQRF